MGKDAGILGNPVTAAASSRTSRGISPPSRRSIERAGLWVLVVAHLVALWSLSWDIRWHLLIGRDSFWIAPHIMTYSGVAAIVLVSFGVFLWTGMRGSHAASVAGLLRHLGDTGSGSLQACV